jgi:hypothetical protein
MLLKASRMLLLLDLGLRDNLVHDLTRTQLLVEVRVTHPREDL